MIIFVQLFIDWHKTVWCHASDILHNNYVIRNINMINHLMGELESVFYH